MWLASSEQWPVLLGGVGGALVLGLVAAVRRSRLLAAISVLLLLCLAAGGVRVWQREASPLRELATEGAMVRVEMRVSGASRLMPARGVKPAVWIGSATLVSVEGRGRVLRSGAPVTVFASDTAAAAWARVPLGTTVVASGRLGRPDPGDPAEAVVRARGSPQSEVAPGAVDAWVQRLRQGLRDACAGLSPGPRGLVPALVVGDTSVMESSLVEEFRASGLTHLCAVSGANLVFLLSFLRGIAVAVGVRGYPLLGVLVLGVVGFVTVCLGEPSVIRAAAMGLVGLAALGRAGRGRQGLRYLAAAVIAVVVVDPWLSRSFGFALSVTASGGLLWWAGRWTDAMASWCPRWLAEGLAVPMAAQLATGPIVAALSGQVSVVGLAANLVAGPFVGPVTVLGVAAASVSLVLPAVAAAIAWVAGWGAWALCAVAGVGASLPGAVAGWPTSAAGLALLTVASLLVAVVLPSVLRRRWLCLLLAAASVVLLLRAPARPGWPPGEWVIAACDVGQGDAWLIRAGPDAAVAVDAGPDGKALEACLTQLGVQRVPLVLLTHLHSDHVTGLPSLLRRGTDVLVLPVVTTPVDNARRIADEASGVRRETAEVGSTWTVGGVRLDVLAAPDLPRSAGEAEGESAAENDASLTVRVEVGGLVALASGDVEELGQKTRLRLGGVLDADVLMAPHHGSGRQSPDFWSAVSPRVVLFSVGRDNGYGHPAARTLALAASTGAASARTDEQGIVVVGRNQQGVFVSSQR